MENRVLRHVMYHVMYHVHHFPKSPNQYPLIPFFFLKKIYMGKPIRIFRDLVCPRTAVYHFLAMVLRRCTYRDSLTHEELSSMEQTTYISFDNDDRNKLALNSSLIRKKRGFKW